MKQHSDFNIAVIIPTGVGAEIGGFAGDAGIFLRYLSQLADTVLTHPNVVNAASFNVLPANAWYVEGYALNAFFEQELGLLAPRPNRIGLVIDRRCEPYLDLIANAVNATAVSTGCQIAGYTLTDQPLEMQLFPSSWGYTGEVAGMDDLARAGRRCLAAGADVLAVLTWMDILPASETAAYEQGQSLDPIGALEALISHALVAELGVPVAHSPIFEPHLVTHALDPRVAAEEIGTTYLPCILMGLSRAPRYTDYARSSICLDDLAAVVCPADACGGIPMLIAAERGIPLIAIAENTTVLNVPPTALGYRDALIYTVANAWEAAGLLQALKLGIDPWLLRRPLKAPFQVLP